MITSDFERAKLSNQTAEADEAEEELLAATNACLQGSHGGLSPTAAAGQPAATVKTEEGIAACALCPGPAEAVRYVQQ